jgi:hypothetical protein
LAKLERRSKKKTGFRDLNHGRSSFANRSTLEASSEWEHQLLAEGKCMCALRSMTATHPRRPQCRAVETPRNDSPVTRVSKPKDE